MSSSATVRRAIDERCSNPIDTGSFGSATCIECHRKYTPKDIEADIFAQALDYSWKYEPNSPLS